MQRCRIQRGKNWEHRVWEGVCKSLVSVRETLCKSGRRIDALKKRRRVLKKRRRVLKKREAVFSRGNMKWAASSEGVGGGFLGGGGGSEEPCGGP